MVQRLRCFYVERVVNLTEASLLSILWWLWLVFRTLSRLFFPWPVSFIHGPPLFPLFSMARPFFPLLSMARYKRRDIWAILAREMGRSECLRVFFDCLIFDFDAWCLGGGGMRQGGWMGQCRVLILSVFGRVIRNWPRDRFYCVMESDLLLCEYAGRLTTCCRLDLTGRLQVSTFSADSTSSVALPSPSPYDGFRPAEKSERKTSRAEHRRGTISPMDGRCLENGLSCLWKVPRTKLSNSNSNTIQLTFIKESSKIDWPIFFFDS